MWDKEEWSGIAVARFIRVKNLAKRNQGRSIKRQAQRSRVINRMRRK